MNIDIPQGIQSRLHDQQQSLGSQTSQSSLSTKAQHIFQTLGIGGARKSFK